MIRELRSRRGQLVAWVDAGAIAPGQIDQALALTGVVPDGKRWRRFLDQLLLVLGALALALAVIFFFAYNWDALGKFTQLGLAEALVALAVLAYWKMGADTVAGKVALLTAGLLVGALLALYGQTYQTGADTWQLFASWAVLILPWTLLGRFAPLWLLWLGLLNIALVLYHQAFGGLFWAAFGSGDELSWWLLLINTLAWALWELMATRIEWLAQRWAVRLVGIASGTVMTLLVLRAIFESSANPVPASLTYIAWLAGLYLVYRRRRPDLFMLAGACLSLIVCLTSLLVNALLENLDSAGLLLLIALLVIGQAAAAAAWLRRVHAEMSA